MDYKKKYKEILRNFVEPHLDEMCEDCHKRYDTNPLRILDCKSPICKDILQNAPVVTECLCDICNDKFTDFKKMLN